MTTLLQLTLLFSLWTTFGVLCYRRGQRRGFADGCQHEHVFQVKDRSRERK